MRTALLTFVLGALALPAVAHHSAAVFYQMDKEITVEGVVKTYNLGNPHARIYMTVKGADGKDQEWLAEGGSRTVLLRNGFKGDEVKAGDKVKVVGNPSRDGTFVVHWEKLILEDGKVLWGEDVPEPDKLEALRHKK